MILSIFFLSSNMSTAVLRLTDPSASSTHSPPTPFYYFREEQKEES